MASPAALCPASLNPHAPPFIPAPPAALQQPAPQWVPQLPAPPMAFQPPAPQWAPQPPATQWAPQPPVPGYQLYAGMPPEVLPPSGYVAPPFPSLFLSQAVPPPSPQVVAGTTFLGLPAQGPGMGMQDAFPPHLGMPMPHEAAVMPAAPPVGMHAAQQQPQPPRAAGVPQHGGEPPRRAARAMRCRGAQPRPRLDVPPRRQRAAAASATIRGAEIVVSGGDGAAKGDSANEPSPRSVLDANATSPPLSPSIPLPTAFPYVVVSTYPPSAASAVLPPATADPSVGSVLSTRRSPRVRRQPGRRRMPRPPRQAPGGNARRAGQKPRRAYDPVATSAVTTLMIRNIPNSFTRDRLINIVDQHCAEENEVIAAHGGGGVRSEYDFLYVPIDFSTGSNMGFAFVNFTTPDAARRLWFHLHGHPWEFQQSRKRCEVDCANIQGLDALETHFAVSRFDCATEDLLPVRFDPPRDGARPATGEMITVGHLVGRGP